jgi:hypothetical protein
MPNTRNPILIVLVVVGVLVASGLALLFLGTGSEAPPATAPTPTPSATPTSTGGAPTTAPNAKAVQDAETDTSLNLAVANCEGCQVTAQPTSGSTDLQPVTATVADGKAQVDLPTSTTYGLVFSIRGTGDGSENKDNQLVTLTAGGTEPGAAQPSAAVQQASEGSYCWAGTTLDVATVKLTVSGSAATPNAAWADPALPTIGGKAKLSNGASAVPEELKCN